MRNKFKIVLIINSLVITVCFISFWPFCFKKSFHIYLLLYFNLFCLNTLYLRCPLSGNLSTDPENQKKIYHRSYRWLNICSHSPIRCSRFFFQTNLSNKNWLSLFSFLKTCAAVNTNIHILYQNIKYKELNT